MKKPVISAQNITLADGDVITINDLPVTKKLISIITNLVECSQSSSECIYLIVDTMLGMIEVNETDHRFSKDSAYILWYTAQILLEYDRIARKEGGNNE